MQVPSTPADIGNALPQRLGPAAVAAVSAVQALPEEAKNLDTRLALQAVQPNQAGEGAARLRQAIDAPLPQLRSPSAILNWLAQTGTPATATGTSVAAWLAAHFSAQQVASSPWPMPQGRPVETASKEGRAWANRWLTQMQAGLIEAGVFTADQLSAQFFRPMGQREGEQGRLPAATPHLSETPMDDAAWTSALRNLRPESDAAKLAGQMLVSGQLVWNGELAPGVPLQVSRHDAWKGDPETGEAVKGVALHMSLSLRRLGAIEIHAQYFGDQGEVQITSPSADARNDLRAGWTEIQKTLQSLNFRSTLATPNADDE